MEKYFLVTDKCSLKKDFLDFKENSKKVNEIAKHFMRDQGMKTTRYGLSGGDFYIVPTESDSEKFDSQLCKTTSDEGLRRFKKNSEVRKSWIEHLKLNELKIIEKPFLPFYFKNYLGEFRYRLFSLDGEVYCSVESENVDIMVGMKEMKASEFFKVIEDYESREQEW